MTDWGKQVRLEDIPTCFEGVIPSSIATVDTDGTPNVTYLSIVHRIADLLGDTFGEAVIIRFGEGPPVFPADGPEPD